MSQPTVTYDPELDAIAIRFAPEGARYSESEEIAPGVVLDYDAEGRVIGVELLYVTDLLSSASGKAREAKPAAD